MSQRNDQMERYKEALRRGDYWELSRLTGVEVTGLKKAAATNPARYLLTGAFIAVVLSYLNSTLAGPQLIDVLALSAILWGGERSIYATLRRN